MEKHFAFCEQRVHKMPESNECHDGEVQLWDDDDYEVSCEEGKSRIHFRNYKALWQIAMSGHKPM